MSPLISYEVAESGGMCGRVFLEEAGFHANRENSQLPGQ